MKKTVPQKDRKLTPQEYRTILKTVQLKELHVSSCAAKLRKDKLGEQLKIFIEDSVHHLPSHEDALEVNIKYTLHATATTKRDYALKLECSYQLKYESVDPLPTEFVEIFLDVNLKLNTWPYFREYVQNMVSRMNLPPLTLDLLR